jgi:hypothetical protein
MKGLFWLMVSEASVYHGRKDVLDHSSSFHGGQEGDRKRERERDCTSWLSAFSPFILSSSPACKTGATHIQSWHTQRFLFWSSNPTKLTVKINHQNIWIYMGHISSHNTLQQWFHTYFLLKVYKQCVGEASGTVPIVQMRNQGSERFNVLPEG